MESPALAFLISRKALRQRWRSLPGQRWRRCPKTVFLAFVMLSEESISCRPSFHQQTAVHSRIPPKVWPRIERFLTLSKQSSSSSSSRCTDVPCSCSSSYSNGSPSSPSLYKSNTDRKWIWYPTSLAADIPEIYNSVAISSMVFPSAWQSFWGSRTRSISSLLKAMTPKLVFR